MASGSLPHHLHIQSTSAKDGGQSFAGINQGTINYAASDDKANVNDVLNTLPTAADAPFNAYQRQHDPTCLPDTRVDLLRDIYSWADGRDERCIFWLNGLAGTGKSTIARTVARRYLNQKRLGASFFFSRGGGDVSRADKFVTSIASQLASSIPSLDQYVCDAIKERHNIASQSLRDQWQQLVLSPLSKLSERSGQYSFVLVVDALDECENDKDIHLVIKLLAEARLLKTARLRVFLTSRPEVSIRTGFVQVLDTEHQDFVLHNISPSIVDHDIRTFLEHSLELIAQERSLAAGWPGKETIERLVRSASGLFIWAATACRFIREGKRFASKRLSLILENSSDDVNAAEKHLNEIYIAVLRNCIFPDYSYEEAEELLSMLKWLLGSIVTLLSPLSTQSLSGLLGATQDEVQQTLNDLHAILNIPQDPVIPLRLHHPSFRDFLFERARCEEFWVDKKQAHQKLADNCMQLMSTSLKQDVCGMNVPGMLVVDAERSQIERILPPEVQYACRYWIEHVQKSENYLSDNSKVHDFLRKHFLYWLEALGWMGKVSEGVYAIMALESLVSSSDGPGLWSFVHDAKRFVLYNRAVIEQAPLQTYSSALVFAPTSSIVRERFKGCIPGWMRLLPKVEEKWNALLQTLDGHSGWVKAVAFSPDGRTLASASGDKTVKLWDATSGALQQTLDAHSSYVNAVVFSPDGRILASASGDKTVKLWDAAYGALQQTLDGHLSYVNAVAFSPDGRTLASASQDKTVKLWDAASGVLQQTLDGHSDWVNSVAFSPNGKTLASASSDKTIKLWDAAFGALQQTLDGHSKSVSAVAFSPNGRTLASASGDKAVKLWDAASGALQQILDGHSDWVNSVAFSPNGKTLASASRNKTIKLWDAASGALQQTLDGHLIYVSAVAFSPDGRTLASASPDRTVKLWDATSGALQQTLDGHSDWVSAVAFSPDGRTLASASGDKAVKLWDAASGSLQQTLDGHSKSGSAVAFSLDGRTLASASYDCTIKLWDAASGSLQQTLDGHSDCVDAVAFSPDSRTLASASRDSTAKLWDTASGALRHTLDGRSGYVDAVAFSPDGKTLASASRDSTVKLWDAASGALQRTLNAGGIIYSLSFADDGTSLQTNRGSISISAPRSNLAHQPQPEPSIFVEDQWVSCGTTRVLWLPPDHRSDKIALCRSKVAFGYASGRVTIIKIAL